MRALIGLAMIAGAFVAAPGTASAGPWCLEGSRSTENCGFYSFQQCEASRAGSEGICRPNQSEFGYRGYYNGIPLDEQ